MDLTTWLIFASAVFIGSYIQAVIGFAIGIIVMAIGGASGAVSLPVLTAAVSIISLANIIVATQGRWRHVDRKRLAWLVVGQIPALALGIGLITILDRNARWFLELLLGIFIVCGSLSMSLQPIPRASVSTKLAWITAGAFGGLMGGMFSASGPVIGWFAYRQPLGLATIRATMLAFFGLATLLRTAIVGTQGGLNYEVWYLSLVAMPLVVLGAWLGRVRPPNVSEANLKRGVFILLVAIGAYIVGIALMASPLLG